MNRLAIVLMLLFAVVPALGRTNHKYEDWNRVKKLRPDTWIEVETLRSGVIIGSFAVGDDFELTVNSQLAPGLLSPQSIARRDVRVIRQIPRPRSIAHSRKLALLGAVGGAAVGLAVGAIYDAEHPFSDDPGIGKFVFGLLGTVTGPAAVATGELIHRATQHKLIYRASPSLNPPVAPRPPAPDGTKSGTGSGGPAAGPGF